MKWMEEGARAARVDRGCWGENKQGDACGVFLYLWQELAGSQAEQFSLAGFWVSPSLLCIIN